jgi:hypothetical protein
MKRKHHNAVDVLVTVNVGRAIATGDLGAYVFMADTTGYLGSGGAGGSELLTKCKIRDTLVWRVVSIDPAETVAIVGFGGTAVTDRMVIPMPYPQYDGTVWGGRVHKVGENVDYAVTLLLEGATQLSFNASITAIERT